MKRGNTEFYSDLTPLTNSNTDLPIKNTQISSILPSSTTDFETPTSIIIDTSALTETGTGIIGYDELADSDESLSSSYEFYTSKITDATSSKSATKTSEHIASESANEGVNINSKKKTMLFGMLSLSFIFSML